MIKSTKKSPKTCGMNAANLVYKSYEFASPNNQFYVSSDKPVYVEHLQTKKKKEKKRGGGGLVENHHKLWGTCNLHPKL